MPQFLWCSSVTLHQNLAMKFMTVDHKHHREKHVYIKYCVYVYIKYFSKIIQQMKENAGFFHFLFKTAFLDTHSYFLPTDQNALLSIQNQSKFMRCHSRIYVLSSKHSYWPMRVHVLSQLFYTTKCKTQVYTLLYCSVPWN